MEHAIRALANVWHLSGAQYWHLRLLSAVLVVPLLGVLYVCLRRRGRF